MCFSDVKVCIGGEEMVILLLDINEKAVKDLVECVWVVIEVLVLNMFIMVVKIMVSFGVCMWSGEIWDCDEIVVVIWIMFDIVDEVFYKFKYKGRNCVMVKKVKNVR